MIFYIGSGELEMVDKVVNALISICLVVLSLDLIFLYQAGQWYDPNSFIETTELTALALLALLGMGNTIKLMTELFGGGK